MLQKFNCRKLEKVTPRTFKLKPGAYTHTTMKNDFKV